MSANKHTPGPWVAVSDVCGTRVVADGVGFEPPYRLRPGSGEDPQQVADAHLIAAAPDMLEALDAHPDPRDFDGDMGLYLFAFETWRVKRDAAIKKARGES